MRSLKSVLAGLPITYLLKKKIQHWAKTWVVEINVFSHSVQSCSFCWDWEKWKWIEGEVIWERASLTRVPYLLGTLPLIHWSLWFSTLILDFWNGQSLINTEVQNSMCECITYGPRLTSIMHTSILAFFFLSLTFTSSVLFPAISLCCNPFTMSLSFHVAELASTLPHHGVVVLPAQIVCFMSALNGNMYLPSLSVMGHLIYYACRVCLKISAFMWTK